MLPPQRVLVSSTYPVCFPKISELKLPFRFDKHETAELPSAIMQEKFVVNWNVESVFCAPNIYFWFHEVACQTSNRFATLLCEVLQTLFGNSVAKAANMPRDLTPWVTHYCSIVTSKLTHRTRDIERLIGRCHGVLVYFTNLINIGFPECKHEISNAPCCTSCRHVLFYCKTRDSGLFLKLL